MQPTFSLIPPKRVKTIISADKRLASMMISRVKKILAISLIALVGISTMLHLFFTFSDFCGYPMPSVSRYERGSSPTISVGNVQEIHNTLTLTGNERMLGVFSSDDRWFVSTGATTGWTSPVPDFRKGTCQDIWIIDMSTNSLSENVVRTIHQPIKFLLGPSFDFAIAPNNKVAVSGNGSILNLVDGTVITMLTDNRQTSLTSMAFTSDSAYLVAGRVLPTIWNATTFAEIASLPYTEPINGISIWRDNLIVLSRNSLDLWDIDSLERLMQVSLRDLTGTISGYSRILDVDQFQNSIAFIQNGIGYIASLDDGSIRTTLGENIQTLRFSPNGNAAVIAYADHISLLDLQEGTEIQIVASSNRNAFRIREMSFSPTNEIFAVGNVTGEVNVYSVTGSLLATVSVPTSLTGITFNNSGTMLAISGGNVDQNTGGVWFWQAR